MNETDDWRPVTAPRSDGDREWELFYRDDDGLRHGGSVSAPSEALAREQAISLFGHATDTFWLCPADETRRFTTRAFGDGNAPGTGDTDATVAGDTDAPGTGDVNPDGAGDTDETGASDPTSDGTGDTDASGDDATDDRPTSEEVSER